MARYIDAKKIKYTKFVPENDPFDGAGGLCALKSHIDAIPTADVQEVRHGHWIEDKETGCLICSECGRFTDEIIGDMIEQDGKIIHRSMNPFYCSKCGAKMGGKEQEDDNHT